MVISWKHLIPKTWVTFPSYCFYTEIVPMVAVKFLLADASASQSRIQLLILWAAKLMVQLLTKDNKSESHGIQKDSSSHHFKANLYWHQLFCPWMERSKQKNPNWNKTVLLRYKLSLLQAPKTGNTRGVESTPAWTAGGYQLGRVRKALTMQHNTNTRMSTPALALPRGRDGGERKGEYGEQGAPEDPRL